MDKLKAMLPARAPTTATPDDPAFVLFTSGSEGTPKGVVLSHRNLLANVAQVAARIDFSPADIIFNVLPVFHSFGLTGGLVLPLVSGTKTFLYPSPLHYRIIPELVYGTNATAIFGTDTFLMGYARTANPYDFRSLRFVVAGAEPVKAETRRVWMEKFGHRILEGYGVTECSPVLAVNTPMFNRAGTVGRMLPGIEHKLEPMPGIEDAGKLHVRGPNIMLGYLRTEAPGVIEKPRGRLARHRRHRRHRRRGLRRHSRPGEALRQDRRRDGLARRGRRHGRHAAARRRACHGGGAGCAQGRAADPDDHRARTSTARRCRRISASSAPPS